MTHAAAARRLTGPATCGPARGAGAGARRKIAPTRVQHVARDASFEAAAVAALEPVAAGGRMAQPLETAAGSPALGAPLALACTPGAGRAAPPDTLAGHGVAVQRTTGDGAAGMAAARAAAAVEPLTPCTSTVGRTEGRELDRLGTGTLANPSDNTDAPAGASPTASCASVRSATGSSAWPSPAPALGPGTQAAHGAAAATAAGRPAAADGQRTPAEAPPGRSAWERRLSGDAAAPSHASAPGGAPGGGERAPAWQAGAAQPPCSTQAPAAARDPDCAAPAALPSCAPPLAGAWPAGGPPPSATPGGAPHRPASSAPYATPPARSPPSQPAPATPAPASDSLSRSPERARAPASPAPALPRAGRRAAALHGALLARATDVALASELELLLHLLAAAAAAAPAAVPAQPDADAAGAAAAAGGRASDAAASCAGSAPGGPSAAATGARDGASGQRRLLPSAAAAGAYAALALQAAGETRGLAVLGFMRLRVCWLMKHDTRR